MKIKVGDKVRVLAGKDKGKEGTITSILKKKDRVVVSGVNVVKKHIKPSAYNENGGIVEVEASIHISNVKVIEGKDTKVKEATTKAKTVKKTTKKESGEK